MKRDTLFLGNWKMFMRPAEIETYAATFLQLFTPTGKPDVGFAAPYTSLQALHQCFPDSSGILRGAQNVHWLDSGAHTGEISAPMLRDFGVQFVLLGHSERRQFYGETDSAVAKRAAAAIASGLTAVVCIGETKEQYQDKQTFDVIRNQLQQSLDGISSLESVVIAYEPVWAIGTGLAATPEYAEGVHQFIRSELVKTYGDQAQRTLLLYGGSTKPENIADLMAQPNIDGALVGGTSLQPEAFWQLVEISRSVEARN